MNTVAKFSEEVRQRLAEGSIPVYEQAAMASFIVKDASIDSEISPLERAEVLRLLCDSRWTPSPQRMAPLLNSALSRGADYSPVVRQLFKMPSAQQYLANLQASERTWREIVKTADFVEAYVTNVPLGQRPGERKMKAGILHWVIGTTRENSSVAHAKSLRVLLADNWGRLFARGENEDGLTPFELAISNRNEKAVGVFAEELPGVFPLRDAKEDLKKYLRRVNLQWASSPLRGAVNRLTHQQLLEATVAPASAPSRARL
jgi:hypothetical protein